MVKIYCCRSFKDALISLINRVIVTIDINAVSERDMGLNSFVSNLQLTNIVGGIPVYTCGCPVAPSAPGVIPYRPILIQSESGILFGKREIINIIHVDSIFSCITILSVLIHQIKTYNIITCRNGSERNTDICVCGQLEGAK